MGPALRVPPRVSAKFKGMRNRSIFTAALLALAVSGLAFLFAPASAFDNPYRRVPGTGEPVRLSGAAGGANNAWAYYDLDSLESYLRLTIEAASRNAKYSDVQNDLGRLSKHVVRIDNGTRAVVETIAPFNYHNRNDVEVRVQIKDGFQIGKDLWTSLGELVDSSGRTFVRR